MARGKRKMTAKVIEKKIDEQKAVLEKAKLMEAVLKSEHSYAEIMAFIKGDSEE